MNSSKTFHTEIQIRFRDADPAGILFFGNIFGLAHDCFEKFIHTTEIGWKNWFNLKSDYMVPIRHTECDYLKPFFPGETYQVSVHVLKIGESSFTMGYTFSKNGSEHAKVKMVHAFMDAKSKQKISAPDGIRKALTPYLVNP